MLCNTNTLLCVPVNSRNLLSFVVHHHCAFGVGVGYHSCQRCYWWLCENLLLSCWSVRLWILSLLLEISWADVCYYWSVLDFSSVIKVINKSTPGSLRYSSKESKCIYATYQHFLLYLSLLRYNYWSVNALRDVWEIKNDLWWHKHNLFQIAEWEMDECTSGWYHQTWEQSVCCCKC